MSLSIYYNLRTSLKTPQGVHLLVEAMRKHALALPFKEVGEVNVYKRWEDIADFWLKRQAMGHFSEGGVHHLVPALNIIAFATSPGDGCENAYFGFCKHLSHVKADKRLIPTKLDGWRWHSTCKTQFASDPKCGGIENFLRCHLAVIKMLDFIQATGLVEVKVFDQSNYWHDRDVAKLVKEVGAWNELWNELYLP